jgi:signal peptidase II
MAKNSQIKTILLQLVLPSIIIVVLDQYSKIKIFNWLNEQEVSEYAVFFWLNFVRVWNYGISFGLFQSPELGKWLFSMIALGMSLGLIIWWLRTEDKSTRIAIAMIIGGAAGNVLDRLQYGAVADFIDVHLYGWHWPAFNIADSAIVIGVGILLLRELQTTKTTPKP